jgi:hypothetical protein
MNEITIRNTTLMNSSVRSARLARHAGVVVDPDDADGEEAGGVGEVGGPQVQQLVAEVGSLDVRHPDLEDQERCRDREHAVAECLEPSPGGLVHAPIIARRPDVSGLRRAAARR